MEFIAGKQMYRESFNAYCRCVNDDDFPSDFVNFEIEIIPVELPTLSVDLSVDGLIYVGVLHDIPTDTSVLEICFSEADCFNYDGDGFELPFGDVDIHIVIDDLGFITNSFTHKTRIAYPLTININSEAIGKSIVITESETNEPSSVNISLTKWIRMTCNGIEPSLIAEEWIEIDSFTQILFETVGKCQVEVYGSEEYLGSENEEVDEQEVGMTMLSSTSVPLRRSISTFANITILECPLPEVLTKDTLSVRTVTLRALVEVERLMCGVSNDDTDIDHDSLAEFSFEDEWNVQVTTYFVCEVFGSGFAQNLLEFTVEGRAGVMSLSSDKTSLTSTRDSLILTAHRSRTCSENLQVQVQFFCSVLNVLTFIAEGNDITMSVSASNSLISKVQCNGNSTSEVFVMDFPSSEEAECTLVVDDSVINQYVNVTVSGDIDYPHLVVGMFRIESVINGVKDSDIDNVSIQAQDQYVTVGFEKSLMILEEQSITHPIPIHLNGLNVLSRHIVVYAEIQSASPSLQPNLGDKHIAFSQSSECDCFEFINLTVDDNDDFELGEQFVDLILSTCEDEFCTINPEKNFIHLVFKNSEDIVGGEVGFKTSELVFGSGIAFIRVPLVRENGSDLSVTATVSLMEGGLTAHSVHNETESLPPTLSVHFLGDDLEMIDDGIITWDHDMKDEKLLNIAIGGSVNASAPLIHHFSLEITTISIPEVNIKESSSIVDITLDYEYIPYAPSDITFTKTVHEISDESPSLTYVGSFSTADANIDDITFDYCLLSSANDQFKLGVYDDDTEKIHLSHCVNDLENAELYINEGIAIDAGNFDIIVQSCDRRRLCVSDTFEVNVILKPAVIPNDLDVVTCGHKLSAKWKMSQSVKHVTKYMLKLSSSDGLLDKVLTVIGNNEENIPPPMSLELLVDDNISQLNITIIACNPSGCSQSSEPILVEIIDECQIIQIEGSDDGVSVLAWHESPLLRPNVHNLKVKVKLPRSPANGELVTVHCSTVDSEFIVISPEFVTFDSETNEWENGHEIEVSVLDDRDHSNGPWTTHDILCKTTSESDSSIGINTITNQQTLGVYEGGVKSIVIPIRNQNVILPRMAQVYSQMPDGEWLPTIADGKFDLPVSGAMNVSIVCDEKIPGNHFFPNTEVTVAGFPVMISEISNDGHMINFTTPTFVEVCGDKQDCGYQPFEILNPEFAQDGSVVEDVACPDLCPAEGQGIFYTETCIGYDISGSQCLLPEFADQCAFGYGDSCKACPEGAFCPGGLRMWTMPGYWTADETSGETVRCQPPSTERCSGWNATIGESQCGEGYQMGSYGCVSCDSFYYEDTVKTCQRCPESSNSSKKYLTFIYLGIGLIGVFLLTLLMVFIAVKIKGGKFGEGVKRCKDFVLFSVVLLQTFVTVGQFAQAGLPSTVASMYTVLGSLNLNVPLLHPSCLSSDPFAGPVTRLGICVGVLLFALITSQIARLSSKWYKRLTIWRRWSTLWLALLYPLACSEALKMVLFSINSEMGNSSSSWRLRSNQTFAYFGSEHFQAGVLGWIVFLIHVIGFPFFAFIRLRKAIKLPEDEMKRTNRHWEFFIGGTYIREFFWFRHITFLFVFITTFANIYFNDSTIADELFKMVLEVIALSLLVGLLFKHHPYKEVKKWMFPVKVFSLLLCGLAMFVNAACFALDMSDSWQPVVTISAWLLFIGSIVLYGMLIYFFWTYVSANVIDSSLKKRKTVSDIHSNGKSFTNNPLMSLNSPSSSNPHKNPKLPISPKVLVSSPAFGTSQKHANGRKPIARKMMNRQNDNGNNHDTKETSSTLLGGTMNPLAMRSSRGKNNDNRRMESQRRFETVFLQRRSQRLSSKNIQKALATYQKTHPQTSSINTPDSSTLRPVGGAPMRRSRHDRRQSLFQRISVRNDLRLVANDDNDNNIDEHGPQEEQQNSLHDASIRFEYNVKEMK
eukprot:TRINITY_DN2123_c0_g4_i1.p1 TRINITY_DN2123_c0_g4~~TRINITY_DN2123_c0_g4_i1.p1  ORF type:complete len:1965 (-),score=525.98 TRINITY_DN2123_c0_g4_i1:421-6234(-)